MRLLVRELRGMSEEDFLESRSRLEENYRDFEYEYCAGRARADWTMLVDFAGRVVADLGCGYGSVSLPLAERGAKLVVSVDATLERLGFLANLARMRGIRNVVPIHGDVTALPLAAGSIDLVVMVGLLEYACNFFPSQRLSGHQKQIAFLRSLRKVLREGGEIWVGIENRLSPIHFLGASYHHELPFTPLLPRFAANTLTRWVRGTNLNAYLSSARGYRRLLEAAGFRAVCVHHAYPDYKLPKLITTRPDRPFFATHVAPHAGTTTLRIAVSVLQTLAAVGLGGVFSPAFFLQARK